MKELIDKLQSCHDDLLGSEYDTSVFLTAKAEIERLSKQFVNARNTIRDIGEFCSADNSTLGAIERLVHIRGTAQQFLAKTDDLVKV